MKENNFAMPDSAASSIPLKFESNLPFQLQETILNLPTEAPAE